MYTISCIFDLFLSYFIFVGGNLEAVARSARRNEFKQKSGNHPNFEKKALGVKGPFSEQLSEFWDILGANLGVAFTT